MEEDKIEILKRKQEQGIEVYEYILELTNEQLEKSKDLICSICQSLLKNTIEISTCGHLFCEECLIPWIENDNDTCPSCKTNFSKSSIKKSKFIDRLTGQISVSCQFCVWNGLFLDYNTNHINPESVNCCKYMLIQCNKCKSNIKKEKIQNHLINDCNYRDIKCDYCNIIISKHLIEGHMIHECSESDIKCDNNSCNFKGKRKDLKLHKDACKYEKVPCPLKKYGCDELLERSEIDKHLENSMEYHFAKAEEKINDLLIENKNLRIKLMNYEPIDKNYKFTVGEFIQYKIGRDWNIYPISEIGSDFIVITLGDEDMMVEKKDKKLRLCL